ncbi:MAG: hypothetical protein ACR2PQ_02540 [Myxococcota bacterium]
MPRFPLRPILVLACTIGICAPSFAGAAEVNVPRTVGFAKGVNVTQAVRNQCELETVVPTAIADASAKAELVDGAGNLRLEITGLHALGGGVFSGPKWMEVSGRLSRGGKHYTFRAKRFSAMDPFGGTCAILGKIARAIGGDIATWLENPVGKAELGDAK